MVVIYDKPVSEMKVREKFALEIFKVFQDKVLGYRCSGGTFTATEDKVFEAMIKESVDLADGLLAELDKVIR